MNFLAAECARYLATGTVSRANGNRDPDYVPQGVWRVVGDDRWLALSVRNDADWQALCDLAGDEFVVLRGLSLAERKQQEEMLESRLATWLADLDGAAIEAQLQSAGVPAHRVLDTHELFDDAQLAHRRHYLHVAHNQHANAWVESTRLSMSRTHPREPEFAPWFGIDNEAVLKKVLGYDDSRIAELESAGALK